MSWLALYIRRQSMVYFQGRCCYDDQREGSGGVCGQPDIRDWEGGWTGTKLRRPRSSIAYPALRWSKRCHPEYHSVSIQYYSQCTLFCMHNDWCLMENRILGENQIQPMPLDARADSAFGINLSIMVPFWTVLTVEQNSILSIAVIIFLYSSSNKMEEMCILFWVYRP